MRSTNSAAERPAAPNGLVAVKQRWDAVGRPAQSPISWPRQRWEVSFPEHVDLLGRLPDTIGREDVRIRARGAAASEAAAVEAFVASMVWGYGGVGYGRWRTRRVLDATPAAPELLRRAAEIQQASGAVEAYRFLANDGRMKFLGPAFATKFLHFVPQHDDGPGALILDAIVSRAIGSFSRISLSATAWRTRTYERYLALVGGWADDLGIDPVDTEMLLFVSHAPRQWQQDWVQGPGA